jgi:hypothetical protein
LDEAPYQRAGKSGLETIDTDKRQAALMRRRETNTYLLIVVNVSNRRTSQEKQQGSGEQLDHFVFQKQNHTLDGEITRILFL